MAYDPAYAYEVAVIIREGLRRMLQEGEEVFYYITVYNEVYAMPGGCRRACREGILAGALPDSIRHGPIGKTRRTPDRPQLFGSGRRS